MEHKEDYLKVNETVIEETKNLMSDKIQTSQNTAVTPKSDKKGHLNWDSPMYTFLFLAATLILFVYCEISSCSGHCG